MALPHLLRPLCPLVLVSFALLGCESVAPPAAERPAAATVTRTVGADAVDPFAELRQGLTMAEVKALIGEPLQVRNEVLAGKDAPAAKVTLWVYGRTLSSDYKTVVAEMEEVPYFDPLTGEAKPQQQPIHSQERIDRSELIVLAFTGGKVTDIQRQVRQNKILSR